MGTRAMSRRPIGVDEGLARGQDSEGCCFYLTKMLRMYAKKKRALWMSSSLALLESFCGKFRVVRIGVPALIG